jgi:serine/threonine protein kinase/tetratricopeptide (TPR) repeat protein
MNLRKISHYDIIERLGEGGMGVVYKARDINTDEIVAVKVLSHQSLLNEEIKRRFQREASAGLKLVHPNIVKILEVGEDEGTYFICMEYIQGQTLRELLHVNGPFDVRKVLRIGTDVNHALGAAHSLGIIHRDIKSDNIMLTVGDVVKVMDFGLAKFQDASMLTREGEVVGTVSYMSPQQVMGESIDIRSDIFSLGVVLYELLSGQMPFSGEYNMAIVYSIINEEPVHLNALVGSIPPALVEVICKSLQKEPTGRYQDTESFIDDLKRVELIMEGSSELSVISSTINKPEPSSLADRKDSYLSLIARKGFQARLSGRDEEFEKLKTILDKVVRGKGQITFVSGEAGIGKSRLVTELQKYARTLKIRTLLGQCQGRHMANPYQPFIDIIRQYFDMMGVLSKEKLELFIRTNMPDLIPMIAVINMILDLSEKQKIEIKEQIWDTLYKVLVGIVSDKPCIFFIDDLHWSDIETLDLLNYTAHNISRQNVLIIGTYRPEDIAISDKGKISKFSEIHQSLRKLPNFTSIELKRLDEYSLRSMVNSLFRDSSFDEKFYQSIYSESDGNPFFIVEILKLLQSEGFIEIYNGGYHLRDDYKQGSIPDKIQDIVLRRIENLSDQEREVLELGAVEGDFFHSDTIQNCLDINRLKLLKILQHLERDHHLIYSNEAHYCFDHNKIQTILYDAITPELRKEYHSMVGEYLASTMGDDDLLAQGIAHHFLVCDKNDKALPFIIKAGKRSKNLFATEQSIQLYQKALQIIEESDTIRTEPVRTIEKFSIIEDLGEALFITGKFDHALEQYNIILSSDHITLSTRAELEWKVSLVLINKGNHDEALRYLNQAELNYKESINLLKDGKIDFQADVLDSNEEKFITALGKIKISRARIYKATGNYPQAIHEIKEGLSILDDKAYLKERSQAYNNLGNILFDQGKYNQSAEMHTKSLSLREEIADKKGIAETYNNLANVYYEQGNYQKSASMCEKSLEMMQKIGYQNGIAGSFNNLATIYQDQGRYQEAYDAYQNGLSIWEKIGDKPDLAIAYANLGSACIDLQKWDEAENCLQKSIALYDEVGLKYFMPQAMIWYCQVLLEKKHYQEALDQADKALNIAKEHDQKASEGLAKRMLAKIELTCLENENKVRSDTEKIKYIEKYFDEALHVFQELGMRHEIGRTHMKIAHFQFIRGAPDKAQSNLREATAIFKQLGAIGDLKKSEQIHIE